MKIESDFLVIGSGIAGLAFALQASGHGRVALITKREIAESATNYAQGGIASVFSQEDTFAAHIEDTIVAGAGICHEDVVRSVVEEGPAVIRNLIEWGVKFTTRGDSYDLTREGGHSKRRILHADDATGREIERALVAAVRENANIDIYEHHIAIDLLTAAKVMRQKLKSNRCCGAHVLDIKNGEVKTFAAKITLLASGGRAKFISILATPTSPQETASPWPTEPARPLPTWNSCSFIPQPFTIPMPSPFSSPRRLGEKGPYCEGATALLSWRSTIT